MKVAQTFANPDKVGQVAALIIIEVSVVTEESCDMHRATDHATGLRGNYDNLASSYSYIMLSGRQTVKEKASYILLCERAAYPWEWEKSHAVQGTCITACS